MSDSGASVVVGTFLLACALLWMAANLVSCSECVSQGGAPVENYWGGVSCVDER